MRKIALALTIFATASAYPAFASPKYPTHKPTSVKEVTVCIINHYPDGAPYLDCQTVYYYDDEIVVA